ncbi:uncharacterized protein LOC110055747 [Orbicella faveolata]|uniref:uncharacterized protein LOC110055747 n=1 Tax=Orbicella faveolata TaxID=48498 RepID=UPI0009E3AC26|nr:uncharacterized protein LOC110055747 [Orbicella faveolata]
MAVRASYFLFLVFIAINLFSALAKDFDKETCGGICMKILRKSGKIAILRCSRKGGKKPDFSKAFTIGVDHVKQLDVDGKPVGKPMNSLASQDFIFKPLNKEDTVDGIKAASVELEAHLKDTNGTLRIKTYTFCNAGNSSFGDDTFAVQNGSLKVFIELTNFTFCNGRGDNSSGCKDKPGKDIEIGLTVRSRKGKPPTKRKDDDDDNYGGNKANKGDYGKEGAKAKKGVKGKEGGYGDKVGDKLKNKGPRQPCQKKKHCGIRFRFGDDENDDDEMSVAQKCKRDGKYSNMTGGYPKFEKRGNKEMLIFRAPRFTKSIVFDPVTTLGDELGEDDDDDDDGDDKDEKNLASSIQLNSFMFVAMVTAVFAFILPFQCKRDGKYSNMTGGYPKFEKRGNKEMLIFRAPRFTKSIVFDPVTTLGDELGEDDDDDDDGDDKDEKNLASSIQLNSFMFVAMVTAVFAFM